MPTFSKISKNADNLPADNFKSFPAGNNATPTDPESWIHFFNHHSKIRIANQLGLRRKGYELLHKLYSKMGIAPDDHDGMWLSIHDALPETTMFLAENHQGDIDGALTVVFDSPIGLPADALYKEEIDRLRSAGRKISEIISLGIRDTAKGSVKSMAGLFYCAYLLSWRSKKFTDFVITVHERYENFYCRFLLFKKIGAVRNYAKVNGAPTVLLHLPLMLPDMLTPEEKLRVFPLSLIEHSEKKKDEVIQKIEAMSSPMSEEEFRYFFIEKTDIWKNATPQEKNYIGKIFPPPLSEPY
jgi:hypothetical protein